MNEVTTIQQLKETEKENGRTSRTIIIVLLVLCLIAAVALGSLAAGAGIYYMVTKEPETIGNVNSETYEYERVSPEQFAENFPAEQFSPTEYTTHEGVRLDAYYGCAVYFGDVTLANVRETIEVLAVQGIEPRLWYPGDAVEDGMLPAEMENIQLNHDVIGASLDYYTYRGGGHEYLFGMYDCNALPNGR